MPGLPPKISRFHRKSQLGRDAIRHQGGPLRLQKEQLRRDRFWQPHGQGTERPGCIGWVGLTEALVETQAVDGDGAEDRPDLRRVIPLTALPVAAMGTRTLCLQVRRQLLLHDDLLQAFEDRFAFSEGEAQRGGREVLPRCSESRCPVVRYPACCEGSLRANLLVTQRFDYCGPQPRQPVAVKRGGEAGAFIPRRPILQQLRNIFVTSLLTRRDSLPIIASAGCAVLRGY
jgi:hypothetical protein